MWIIQKQQPKISRKKIWLSHNNQQDGQWTTGVVYKPLIEAHDKIYKTVHQEKYKQFKFVQFLQFILLCYL
jgi:hypothetical protein